MSNSNLPPFIFHGQEMYYDCEWVDEDRFEFYFGDGYFVDDEGDDYYIQVIYLADVDEFIINVVYEYEILIAKENHLSKSEQEEVKKYIKSILEIV